MSPERKPGDPGWKPSEEDIRAAQQPAAGLVLRIVSVVPFVALGVLGVLALVSWAAVFVFGVGNPNGAVWTWAQGKPAGEVVSQVALMLLLGRGVPGGGRGFDVRHHGRASRSGSRGGSGPSRRRCSAVMLILLIWGSRSRPEAMAELGLDGVQWWVAFVWLAFSIVVAGLRMRRRGHDGGDGADG